MKRPLLSCVIPVKGARPFMDEALASLRTQGLEDDLEIIVQDADVEPDKGQSDALNRGFAKARGEWLFWLNADDVLLPGALKAVAAEARRPDVAWIAGNMAYMDVAGNVIKCLCDGGWKCTFENLPVQVYGPSSFFRRELLERCGPFDVALRVSMDTDMWMRFREHGFWFKRLPRYVWGFRRHDGSLTKMPNMPSDVREWQRRENAEVQARHRLSMTRWNLFRARFLRLLNGSYLKGAVDTLRFRGRNYNCLHGGLSQ